MCKNICKSSFCHRQLIVVHLCWRSGVVIRQTIRCPELLLSVSIANGFEQPRLEVIVSLPCQSSTPLIVTFPPPSIISTTNRIELNRGRKRLIVTFTRNLSSHLAKKHIISNDHRLPCASAEAVLLTRQTLTRQSYRQQRHRLMQKACVLGLIGPQIAAAARSN
jgi:hypothetical protein